MSNSVYSTDSSISGKLTISGNLQNKNKIINSVSTPSLGTGETNISTGLIDYYVTLTNPLSETIVLDTQSIKTAILNSGNPYYTGFADYPVKLTVTLPPITSIGMTVNFIKNNVLSIVTFKTLNSDRIVRQGTENQSIVLLSFYNTSIQLIGLNTTKWLVNDLSLPPKISNPVGSIITMPVQNLPNGYLYCDGTQYHNSNYPDLYLVLLNKYFLANDLTTSPYFRVPNFNNGSFLRGCGGNSEVIGKQQGENIRTHTHSTLFYRFNKGSSGGTHVISDLPTEKAGNTTVTSDMNTAGLPDETRPVNYAVYYCIKY